MRETDFKAMLSLLTPQLIKREMKLEGLNIIAAAKKVYASQEYERIEQKKLQPFMELVCREDAFEIGRRGEIYLYAIEIYRQEEKLTGRELERLFTEHGTWEKLMDLTDLPKLLSPGRVKKSVNAIL